ncbi:MAG: acyltransferase [Bacteroidia bacterium]
MNRLYNLDYLRGLAAFGIMIFHYLSWTLGDPISMTSGIMGRIGIYGVSIFYVLSGLTLYYVYFNKMEPSKADVIDFVKKRFFRIFPLLWLSIFGCIALTVILKVDIEGPLPDFKKVFLNVTGLFGLIDWNSYIAPGSWSIGNELVFYIFFPFFILFTRKSKVTMIILSVILLVIYLYFAFYILDPAKPIKAQWANYVNPLNQVFLFLSGFLMGYTFHSIKIGRAFNLLILFFGLGLFIFYPVTGNPILLATGLNRIIFTISCFAICLGFYKLDIKFPAIINKPLALLGEASYSVYLLHALVYIMVGAIFAVFSKHFFYVPESVKLIVAVAGTVGLSYFVYENFEKYFMKMAKKKTVQL